MQLLVFKVCHISRKLMTPKGECLQTCADLEYFLNECQKCKLLGGSGGMFPLGKFFVIYLPKFPFLGSDRILTRFQLGKFFIIKNIFIMKNLTDFCKMMETGVEPHLICLFERHVKVVMCLTLSWFEFLLRKWASNQQNVSQNQWTVKMFCSYCTLLEAQGNQRAWYTHRLGTFFIPS